ncbi:MAG: hypothetical protein ACJARI_002456, partial [Bacteroidia bacterium]
EVLPVLVWPTTATVVGVVPQLVDAVFIVQSLSYLRDLPLR